MAFWNRIINWFRDLSERNRLINDFNHSAREAFAQLSVSTLLNAMSKKGTPLIVMNVQVSFFQQVFA